MTQSDSAPQKFWGYSIEGGEFIDAEFATKEQALQHAQTRYNEDCSDGDDFKHDQSAEIKLVEYYTDDEGDTVAVQTVKDTVEYEYYHGDLAEHGTVW